MSGAVGQEPRRRRSVHAGAGAGCVLRGVPRDDAIHDKRLVRFDDGAELSRFESGVDAGEIVVRDAAATASVRVNSRPSVRAKVRTTFAVRVPGLATAKRVSKNDPVAPSAK